VNLGGNLGLGDEPTTINKYLSSGIHDQILAYLNATTAPERKNTSYGLPAGGTTGFQGPRQVRLGVRYTF
jgi:hypothetical protein